MDEQSPSAGRQPGLWTVFGLALGILSPVLIPVAACVIVVGSSLNNAERIARESGPDPSDFVEVRAAQEGSGPSFATDAQAVKASLKGVWANRPDERGCESPAEKPSLVLCAHPDGRVYRLAVTARTDQLGSSAKAGSTASVLAESLSPADVLQWNEGERARFETAVNQIVDGPDGSGRVALGDVNVQVDKRGDFYSIAFVPD